MTRAYEPTTGVRTAPTTVMCLLLAACCLLLAACGGDDGEAADDAAPDLAQDGTTIVMQSNQFDPQSATVEVGDEVTFENADGYDHNVRGNGIEVDDFSSGSQTVTVDEPGTIEYECTLHEGMTGTLEVTEPGEA